MADNTTLNPGTGGDIISTDVITTLNGSADATGEKAQRVKIGWGVDATFNDTNAAQPLPVVQTGTPGLPTGASTSALQTTGNTSLSSIDGKITAVNTGAVVVSSSALPTGAATAAKQPALGTAGTASVDVITVQGKTSMTPLLVDPSGVTSPVSAASLPLPSGASTSAKQPALGTAGTASADVITVQGKALMTPVLVDGSAVTQPISGTVTTSPPSNASVNVNQVAGTTTDTNSGTKSAGTQRVVLATDQPALTNALKVDGSAVTQPVSLASTTVTGTVAVTESGTWNVGSSAATGSAVPANGFYTGGIAKTALPAAGSDGNLTGNMADKFGRQVFIPQSIRDLVTDNTVTLTASTAETTILTAVASVFLDLTAVTVSNTSATPARVDFRDTTAGTVRFSIYVPAGDVRGMVLQIPRPQGAVNTNWTAQSSASVTDLRVWMQAVQNK